MGVGACRHRLGLGWGLVWIGVCMLSLSSIDPHLYSSYSFKYTNNGPTDLAQHYLLKAGITAFRRIRKSDNNRIAR